MTIDDVNSFEKARGQLQQLHNEISLLSKSKPDNPINKFKLEFINEALATANVILTADFKPFKDFAIFNADEMPTNSDVVMILSQYIDCLESLRSANIYNKSVCWYWRTEEESLIRTEPPTRFRKVSK